MTSAKVYESEVADALVSGDEGAFYGDRAYQSERRSAWLASVGIQDRTMRRADKHHPALPYWQQRHNHLIDRIRRPVEGVFGTLKRVYRYERVRYRGPEWNATEM